MADCRAGTRLGDLKARTDLGVAIEQSEAAWHGHMMLGRVHRATFPLQQHSPLTSGVRRGIAGSTVKPHLAVRASALKATLLDGTRTCTTQYHGQYKTLMRPRHAHCTAATASTRGRPLPGLELVGWAATSEKPLETAVPQHVAIFPGDVQKAVGDLQRAW